MKESLRCMNFCSSRLGNQSPDNITLCRFSNEIVVKKGYNAYSIKSTRN
ncbi:MAG: hypothetical protein ACMUEL_03115 [Flavobacteriales bacterium Tduv]